MSRKGPTTRLTSAVRSMSRREIPRRQTALVVGGGHVGQTVAADMSEDYDVRFLSRKQQAVERIARRDVTAHHVKEIDATSLAEANAEEASLAVVTSEEDSVNFLVAQLLRARFSVEDVVIRVNDREKLDSFADLDVETVSVSDLLTEEVSNRLESVADEVAETR